MCVVSMVSDFYREKWPSPILLEPNTIIPFTPVEPIRWPVKKEDLVESTIDSSFHFISAEEWKNYQELKRKAAEYDARTNQPDCVKPDVEEWENDIEAFLILMGLLTEDDIWQKEFRAGIGG